MTTMWLGPSRAIAVLSSTHVTRDAAVDRRIVIDDAMLFDHRVSVSSLPILQLYTRYK